MNKQEIYEASLKMLALSGQGAPVKLLKRYPENFNWSLVEELISENKLIITNAGTGLDHLCVADDRYYRTEIDDPKVRHIELMRHYIGIIGDDYIIPFFNVSVRKIIEDNKEQYDNFLSEFKIKLDALKQLKIDLITSGILIIE